MTFIVCNFLENAKTAGLTSLLGMLIIFAVLAVLWGAIELFRMMMQSFSGKSESAPKKQAPPAVPAVTPAPAAAPAPVQVYAQSDEEIVAAITSALAEYLGTSQSSFRVVSFKKVAPKAHWNN